MSVKTIWDSAAFWKRGTRTGAGDDARGGTAFSSRYVGRAKEIALFTDGLQDRRKIVVGISGDDGFGKSTLLATFEQIALEGDIVTALATETGEGIPALLGRLADRLARNGAQLGTFDARYRTYRQRLNQLEADPQAPKGLAVLAAGTVARGGLAAGRLIPGVGAGLAFVPEDAVARGAEELTSYVLAKVGNKDEVKLVLNPVEELSTVFLQDVRKQAPRRVALFVDADDASCRDVHAWLLGVVQEDYGEIPDGLLLAVASPRELDRADWVELEPRVTRVSVGPLSDDEARAFLARAGIANDAVVAEIVRRSGGVPLALAVLAAERPESPEQVGDPNGTAVEGFLSSVSEPARRRLAVDASIPRLLNRDVLAVLLERTDVLDDFAWLSELPFVKDAPEGWLYSEPVRVQMLRRSRRDAPESWTRLHGKLAEYYARLEPGEDERGADPEWQGHELERTYHRLCSEPRRAVGPALNGFMFAFASDRRFARRYAEALRQAGIDTGRDRVRALGETLVAGTTAIDDDDNEKAREMFTTLLGEDELDDMWRAKASDWRGYLAALDGRLDEALPDFDTAVELEPDSAEYRIDRGRTLARCGRYDEALADLDRAVALDPENSVAFVARADTRQLAGRLDEAAADIGRAVELQPKNTAAWLLQADILQLTGETEEAFASVDRAVEIEPENPQAWVVHARIQQALGRTDAALADLDRAVSLAPDDVGMLALRANMHVRAGDLARAREDLETAVARSDEFASGEAGELLAAMTSEEVDQRMTMAASLSGIDGREAARQLRAYRAGPDAVKRVLEADLATIEALIHVQAGDVDAGLASSSRAIELDPERSLAWGMRAQFALTLGRLDEALDDVRHASELAPEDYRLVALRAAILQRQGDLAELAETACVLDEHAGELVDQLVAEASGVASLQGSIPGTLGANLAAAQELTALAVADRDAAIRVFRSDAAASEALYFESIPDHDRAIGALTRSIELTASSPKPELFMRRGEALRLAGRLDEALADFDRALELAPDSALARGSRGQTLRALGRTDEALADLDRALAADDSLVWAYAERGELHARAGRLDAALVDFDRVVVLAPDSGAAHGSRGQVLRALGRTDEAFVELDRALELDDSLGWANAERGLLHAQAGRFDAALPDLDRALVAFSDSVELLAARARARLGGGRLDEALADARRASELAPGDYTLVSLGAAIMRAQGDLAGFAEAARTLGEHAEELVDQMAAQAAGRPTVDALAADDAPAVITLAVSDREAAVRAVRADAAASESLYYESTGDHERAIAALTRALELGPPSADLFVRRGENHRRAEHFEEALADFDQALELAPDSAVARGSRGQALRALGRTDDALADLSRALELDGDLHWARADRAALYAETERWDEAAADFERVLEIDPDNLAWLVLRGQALLMLGRYEDALAPLDRAVELDESQSLSYGFRGAVRSMLRDEPGALADLGRAVELAPGWDWAQSLLAETLLLSGRNDEALAASEAAVELAPEDNWHRYVRALARASAGDPDSARADLDAAIGAAEEAGSRSPRELMNLAVWRLARDAPRDVEVAERIFGEVAPESEAHRSEVIRDLETLGRVRGSETATRIAGALAGETRSPVSATPG